MTCGLNDLNNVLRRFEPAVHSRHLSKNPSSPYRVDSRLLAVINIRDH